MNEDAYKERLRRDIADWRQAEIITEPQERAILGRVGIGEPRARTAFGLGPLVSAMAIIAVLVVFGGITSLFAANWDGIPRELRAATLIAAILAAYGLGWVLIKPLDMERIGAALLLLGAILFEASVFLFADMYGLSTETPALWLVAAIGIFPLAYAAGSRIILLGAIANVVAFVIAQVLDWYPDSPNSESALLVVAALAVGLYVIGRLHDERPSLARFAETYALAALLVVMGLLYAFTFSGVWRAVIDSGVEAAAAPPVVYISIVVAATLALAVLQLRRTDRLVQIEAAIALRPCARPSSCASGLLGLAAIVATWPAWTGYAVIFNLAYFALACACVARGYLLADERYVNLGLVALVLGLITRYADVFWSHMTPSSFFILGGVVLFGIALGAERLRRSLLRDMRGGPPAMSGPAEAEAPA